jgi:DNA-binding transcriptional regulator YdaS (Cro superfamily)
MSQDAPLDRAIKAAGGGRKLAAALGVSPMAVSQWKKRGVPAERVPALVRACGNAVQGHELRPDLPDLFPVPASVSVAA